MSRVSGGEEYLIKQGLVGRRSEQRRAALGCLGCIWTQREDQEQPVFATVAEIESCTGMVSGSVSNILKQLRNAEVVSAQVEPSEIKGKSHLRYMPVKTGHGRWLHALLDQRPACQKISPKEPAQETPLQTPGQTAAELIGTLKNRRLELGLLQGEFCEILGVSRSTFSKQETLKNAMDLEAFASYAGALGLRIVLEPIDPVENDQDIVTPEI